MCTNKNSRGLKLIEVKGANTDFSIDTIETGKQINSVNACYRNLRVNGCTIRFKIDTGAQVNILPIFFVRKYGWAKEIKKASITGGTSIDPIGMLDAVISYNEKTVSATFYIVDCAREVHFIRTVEHLLT